MSPGTQNLAPLGQLRRTSSQLPGKIDPIGVTTTFTVPVRVVLGLV